MKNPFLLSLLIALSFTTCQPTSHNNNDNQNTITMLSSDQVLALSPFMVDVKKVGDLAIITDTLIINDTTTVVQQRKKQSFTFRVLVDENNHPVMPDSTATAERRVGDWRNGGIETFCMGGCIVFIGSSLCLLEGCTPIDNGCGCKPPVCGGGCQMWPCSSEILGSISGSISIQ